MGRGGYVASRRASDRASDSPTVDQLCWTDLEAMHGLFVDRQLDLHATDLLFRLPLRGYVDEFVYLPLEHQSRVDATMPLRFTEYHLCVCKRLSRRCDAGEPRSGYSPPSASSPPTSRRSP